MVRQTAENFDYSGLRELENSEVMQNYNAHIVEHALHLVESPKKIVDFGAGIGTLALYFRRLAHVDPLCVEIDQKNQEILRRRKFAVYSEMPEIKGGFELIFSSNVLEHIYEDVDVLKNFESRLSKDGIIFLYLPAFNCLWTELDDIVGHYRRYSRKDILQKMKLCSLRVELVTYADSLGFLSTMILKLLRYDASKILGSPKSLAFYDKWIFPLSRCLDNLGLKKIFGKNIIVVAKKAR